jgi:glycosyltransferase involved in cell wall biosynthesis
VIVLLHAADAYGAVERYVADILRGLRGRGEAAVLLHPDVPALAAFATLAGDGVRVERYPPALLHGPAPRALALLTRRLRALRPRIVHVADVWPVAHVAARLAGSRVVVTHHTPDLPRRDSLAGRAWRALGWLVRPEVVYTSETDRRADGRRLLRTRVIPLGIDLARFENAQPALAGPRPLIGNVARLAEQKGHRYLVDAAPRVLARHPQARFVVAGDGELRGTLEELVRERGLADHVELLGARDDVPELLASFDVFAFPSLFEGLCLAVIEAQAAGVPVVATPVGGIRETVVPGETGLLCRPRDAEALADGILRLLERPDEASALAAEARRRVRERFTTERMVEATLALYDAVRTP